MKKNLEQQFFKKQIRLIFATILLVAVIYSCTKTDWNLDKTNYQQDKNFFQRNDTLKTFYAQINGTLADNALLDKVIEHFKDFDNHVKILNEVEKKYGRAFWDISFVLRDFNGLRTVVTPIINSADIVTALIFSSERNSDYTYFRIIDKQTKQTNLKEYGDKAATLFTQSTLKGLFSATQINFNHAKSNVKNIYLEKQYSTNSASVNMLLYVETCWSYSYTYNTGSSDPYDAVGVAVGTQCEGHYVYIDLGGSSGTGLNSSTPTYNGVGGTTTSTSSVNNIINQLKDPCFKSLANKMINNNLQNIATNILQNTFGVSPKINLIFAESTTIVDKSGNPVAAQTSPNYNSSTNVLDITTYIRLDQFDPNASQEYKASILIHEIVHAYIYANPSVLNGLTQHTYMLQNYINGISNSLQSFFSILPKQAASLAIGGLGDDIKGTPAFNDALSKYGFNSDTQSADNYANFSQQFEYGTIGTKCPDL
jgi:hypothetical protein